MASAEAGAVPVGANGEALSPSLSNFGSVDRALKIDVTGQVRATNDACLNHLFTHFDCGATLGVAYVKLYARAHYTRALYPRLP